MTCAWIDTSRAETGSSATISLRPQRERAGDADALPLAAGELVRVAVVVLGVQADELQQVLDGPLRRRAGGSTFCSRNGAPTIAPTVWRGFSDEYGSWKIIWMSRRSGRILPCRQVRDVVALEHDLAAGRLEQPGDQPTGGGLAAPRLADQAEGLARAHGEVDAVDRLDRADLALEHDAAGDREVLGSPVTRSRASPLPARRSRPERPAASGSVRSRFHPPCDTGPWAAWLCGTDSWACSGTWPSCSAVHCLVLGSAVRWQAASCPGVTVSRSAGRSVSQRPSVSWRIAAARVERAAQRHADQAGRGTGDREEPARSVPDPAAASSRAAPRCRDAPGG